MDRVEITGIVDAGAATAQLVTDQTDGAVKLAILVTIAGQDEPLPLVMTGSVAGDLEHLLSTGHLRGYLRD